MSAVYFSQILRVGPQNTHTITSCAAYFIKASSPQVNVERIVSKLPSVEPPMTQEANVHSLPTTDRGGRSRLPPADFGKSSLELEINIWLVWYVAASCMLYASLAILEGVPTQHRAASGT